LELRQGTNGKLRERGINKDLWGQGGHDVTGEKGSVKLGSNGGKVSEFKKKETS